MVVRTITDDQPAPIAFAVRPRAPLQKLTGLWPDLASGFQHAPDRQLRTVESRLARLRVFRNRLAHHQRVWSHDPEERYEDLLVLAGYIDRTDLAGSAGIM